MGYPKWSEIELQRLKNLSNTSNPNWEEIAQHFKSRTAKGVENQAVLRGFFTPKSRRQEWPQEQKDYLFRLCESGIYTLPQIERRMRLHSQKKAWPVRSASQIKYWAYEEGYSFDRRNLAEWLTVSAIATGLGHKSNHTAKRWVTTGILPSVGGTSAADPYRVRLKDFVYFALANPGTVANYQISTDGAEWLVMLIADVAAKKSAFNKRGTA